MANISERQAIRNKRLKTVLQNCCIGIAGLGGLGSNVAEMLIRSGAGRLKAADFDRVDRSNLYRQCYRLSDVGKLKTDAIEQLASDIAPNCLIEKHNVRIDSTNACGIFSECDIVCECLDKAESKQELIETLLKAGRFTVIAGSGAAGFGKSNMVKTTKISDRMYVAGDLESSVEQMGSLWAPRVALAAAHQANCVLEVLEERLCE
ncbi:sulfur carrier protein ThiS adenylyltransferase ThiF [Sedimentisphaera salicampi]|uniref:sulfur carrier protein ThiS adenylyltransferase ThiF n=1 Tax=Sedimentisphaera salicampi TaxID=1941349 RepID=UPI000B9C907E|nr:sulfur carrier protein ThiS adenylyltransferase ThiF [Sedimentisphaera salicampi]OXU14965.1 putative adenylyltransferase/sulfurtransferase MoeZ [Sedimentisphaera salicampi]